MKSLVISFLFLNVALAGYLPQSKIDGQQHNALASFTSLNECEASYNESCVYAYGYDHRIHELGDETYDKAIYSKNDTESCVDEIDCDQKHLNKSCADASENPIKNYDTKEVYCSKFLRNDKVPTGAKILVVNQAKKDALTALENARKIKEAQIAAAMKSITCGRRVIALLSVKNSLKGLTNAQVKQMNNDYKEIKGLLESGALDTSKEEINAITPDGTIVTAQDKIDLIAEIDGCK